MAGVPTRSAVGHALLAHERSASEDATAERGEVVVGDPVPDAAAPMARDRHEQDLRSERVEHERGERVEHVPGTCPSCGVELHAHEVERAQVACADCDLRLERELAAYLSFVAVTREKQPPDGGAGSSSVLRPGDPRDDEQRPERTRRARGARARGRRTRATCGRAGAVRSRRAERANARSARRRRSGGNPLTATSSPAR